MYTQKVREFSLACQKKENSLPQTPHQISSKQISFIKKMVNDELEELEEAKTIGEQSDALIDAIYYICDSAVKHGINLDKIFDIVHKANMTKVVDGKVIRREDGKILKPQNWQDPRFLIEEEIKNQQKNGSFNVEN